MEGTISSHSHKQIQCSPVQWVLNTHWSHCSEQLTFEVLGWRRAVNTAPKLANICGSFFGPFPPLDEEENPGSNMAVVTVAARHKSQWIRMVSIQSSHCDSTFQVWRCLSGPVQLTLLPAKHSSSSAVRYQVHSRVQTHKSINTFTCGLSSLLFFFKFQS